MRVITVLSVEPTFAFRKWLASFVLEPKITRLRQTFEELPLVFVGDFSAGTCFEGSHLFFRHLQRVISIQCAYDSAGFWSVPKSSCK